ncbi:hypothetical protein [Streptomyces nigrescens]|uniref:hypothetical protein n=1 Tax=Streptomyces nigrescens TaxID=1920 RepID=UPI0021C27D3B|nr:hypothetical protein [Streptomyces nigrescens]
MTRIDVAQGVSTRAVILGPYTWSGGTADPLFPGLSKFFAVRILRPVNGVPQILQALTVTAVASQHEGIQAVGVTDLSVITETDGHIGVNFNVANLHGFNTLYEFSYYFSMIVPE